MQVVPPQKGVSRRTPPWSAGHEFDLSWRYFGSTLGGRATFRVAAAASALVGALLLLGTWDGLYSRLDLPQALPAFGPQLGGIALLSLAFLLWSAASNPALSRPVAAAGAFFFLGAAGVTAAWLIFKHKIDLEIGERGWVILIVTAAVFAVIGAALARAARS